MSATQTTARPGKFIWIWLLPLAVFGLILGMAYQSWASRGPRIEITFENGRGIVSGQTVLLYKGIEVGTVVEARLSADLSEVVVTVGLDRDAENIAVEGSRFWITRPVIGLSGVEGLDTLFSGVYLEVEPGSGSSKRRFTGLASPPVLSSQADLPVVLLSDRARSVQAGAPVTFRDVPVGRIKTVAIAGDGGSVRVEAVIGADYVHLVRGDSRFWSQSGIAVKGSLLGVSIQTDSLDTILQGGIAFATPAADSAGQPAEPGMVFRLYEKPEKDWLEWGNAPLP